MLPATDREDGGRYHRTIKDSEYGKQNGEAANADFYNKAQGAVLACQKYAEQLGEVGALDGVDAISGAAISFN